MADITTEGYVGITNNINNRLYAHRKNALNGYYYLHKEFSKLLLSGAAVIEVKLYASREYCLEVEFKLRPERYVGWNTAVGGEYPLASSRFVHGASKTPAGSIFYRLRAWFGIDHKDWEGDLGIVAFSEWLLSKVPNPQDFTVTAIDRARGISPSNIQISDTRFGLWGVLLTSKVRGQTKTLGNWASELNIRPNTISTRMCRGYSVDQALLLAPKVKDYILEKLTDPDKLMAIYYLENTAMTHNQVSKVTGYGSTMRRRLKDFKLPNRVFDYCDVPDLYSFVLYRIPRQRNHKLHDFTTLQDIFGRWDDGDTVYSISQSVNVDYHAIKNLVEDYDNARIIGC